MIPNKIKNSMNEYEIFLLLSSVFLHDVGIMCKKTKESDEKIRETHHIRSRDYVVNNLHDLLSPTERHIIGEICYAHRHSVPLESIEEKKLMHHQSLGNQEIHVRFLAALVRLADCCDICHTRTTDDLAEIAKLPAEAKFYHQLHQRVSGIFFNKETNTIEIDFNVLDKKEEQICKDFLVQDVIKHLNSVRDCLIKNGIIYLNVAPSFSQTDVLKESLQIPKNFGRPKNNLKPTRNGQYRLEQKAYQLYTKRHFEESLKLCEKGLRKKETALLYLIKGLNLKEFDDDVHEAVLCLEKASDMEPDNAMFAHEAGYNASELLLDYDASLKYLERAYQLNPGKDAAATLNYAEGLACTKSCYEAYNIAVKVWMDSRDIFMIINSSFIKAYTLCLLGLKEDGLKELHDLIKLYGACPEHVKETAKTWVYNKLCSFLEKEINDDEVKKVLLGTTKLLRREITEADYVTAFQKVLGL